MKLFQLIWNHERGIGDMNRKLTIKLAAIATTILFAAVAFAATSVPDTIKMQNKAYTKHKKGIVMFTHKAHSADYAKKYPEYYKLSCGECHHDKDNKPLSELKTGDDVQSCIACHDKPGERPKGKGAPKLSKKEKLQYHAEALHYNCKGCHKKYNRKYKPKKKAPTTCAKCHPKKKKK